MEKIPVLICGISGNMGRQIAHQIEQSDINYLCTTGFVGPKEPSGVFKIPDVTQPIFCVKKIVPEVFRALKQDYPSLIIIDVTHKDVIKDNIIQFMKAEIPVIVGTIGIKKTDILGINSAPILIGSPNFSTEIASFLKRLKQFSVEHTNYLQCSQFSIIESHQGPDPKTGFAGKKEHSGTADAVANILKGMGGELFCLTPIRDRSLQQTMGVADHYLSGHAWHSYTIWNKKEGALEELFNMLQAFFVDEAVFPSQFWQQSIPGSTEKLCDPKESNAIYTIEKFSDGAGYAAAPFSWKLGYDGWTITVTHLINGRDPYINSLMRNVLPIMNTIKSDRSGIVYDMDDIV